MIRGVIRVIIQRVDDGDKVGHEDLKVDQRRDKGDEKVIWVISGVVVKGEKGGDKGDKGSEKRCFLDVYWSSVI